MSRHIQIIILSVIFLGIIVLPVMVAGLQSGDYVFGGFVYNPLDGNSYLAKMRQGFAGEWSFVLPYTAEHGEGAYIFLFYLVLGHIARLLNVSLVGMYHATRIFGGAWLLWQLFLFAHASFGEDEQAASRVFVLAAFGSGLGWLFFGSGKLMPDILVPEIYPFLSAYVNPHFPLAMGLLLWVFRKAISGEFIQHSGYNLLAGLLIAALLPFAWGLGIIVLAVMAVWTWWVDRKNIWQPFVWLVIGGVPVVIYQISVAVTHPVLRLWNMQNKTPSPSFWEVSVALLPAFFFAIYAIVVGRKKWGMNSPIRLSVVWFITGLVVMFVPFQLQRRFMFAIYIPTIFLAAAGLKMISDENKTLKRWLWPAVLILSLPSNLLVLLLGFYGIQSRDPSLYLSRPEYDALLWVEQFTEPDSLIIASPEIGNYIPAHTGRRVLYGHPFETIAAEKEEALVLIFFGGTQTGNQAAEFLEKRGVDLVFYGPREKDLGNMAIEVLKYDIAYQNEQVSIFVVDSD